MRKKQLEKLSSFFYLMNFKTLIMGKEKGTPLVKKSRGIS